MFCSLEHMALICVTAIPVYKTNNYSTVEVTTDTSKHKYANRKTRVKPGPTSSSDQRTVNFDPPSLRKIK